MSSKRGSTNSLGNGGTTPSKDVVRDASKSSRSSISSNGSRREFIGRRESVALDRRIMSKVSVHRQDILRNASKQVYRRELRNSLAGAEPSSWFLTRVVLTARLRYITSILQKYSVPLVTGVVLAFAWINIDEHSYHEFAHRSYGQVFGHEVSVHFFVNDIFMCFFFGLAVKEVTEALLPGGALSPWWRAVNPLLATLGGIVGPAAVYALTILIMWNLSVFDNTDCSEGSASSSGHRRLSSSGSGSSSSSASVGLQQGADCTLHMLLNGWGIPTATDISLAWMFSLLIFGIGHPAINFMLLCAILDDAIGMIIIAVFYPDPANPVDPIWLLLVFAGMAVSFVMRKLKVSSWVLFVIISGPISWIGFLKSHVHPALALATVVPFMPASHALEVEDDECHPNLGACDLGPLELQLEHDDSAARSVSKDSKQSFESSTSLPSSKHSSASSVSSKGSANASARRPGRSLYSTMTQSTNKFSPAMTRAVTGLLGIDEHEAPLHVFESSMKRPVDFGMFFFGLANAGVRVDSVGGITYTVIIALLVGKSIGITAFSLLAVALGFGLPDGLDLKDLVALSALAGTGLTVALFLANEAFQAPELQGQAKMGAVLSTGCFVFAWGIRKCCARISGPDEPEENEVPDINVVPPLPDDECESNHDANAQEIQ
jgi:Na+/H+ antiporter NhaA